MEIVAAQGELRIWRLTQLPSNLGNRRPSRDTNGNFILAHSEKGHNHVLIGDGDVLEIHTEQKMGTQSLALRTLYAIVAEPSILRQTAADAHVDIALDPGIYEIRTDIEYDPFLGELREIQD